MAIDAEFEFNDEQWQKVLKRLNKKWKDIGSRKEFGGIISASVYSDIIEHFEDEKGPDGKWAAWSDIYEKHLQKIGRASNKKLQFRGKLRQSFTPKNWKSHPDGILFFNNAKTKGGYAYAAGHDEGDGKLPKRKFMWLSSKALRGMIDKTLRWLDED